MLKAPQRKPGFFRSAPSASVKSPTYPTLRANPFPEVTDLFCRLPLSTLFYQPEAVHLGDLLRLEYDLARELFLPADFQGTSRAHRTQQKGWALPAIKPYLQTNCFQGDRPLKRKENSTRGPRRCLRVQLRYREKPTSRRRNINLLPFRHSEHKCPFETELPYGLGSANPRPTAVHMEPFPTSVLQVLIEVFATTTKICTKSSSTRAHALGFVTALTAAYSLGHRFYPKGGVWVGRLSAIHFQG